ncbi:DUF1768-domain-containing protein [Guyanagaster necrorhizus]|uniref:DUF1768-domain-containing protein n=1 Tax=Guyanagaster necrorhizus TaxID=856835 RepID=A0A9P7W3G1_9AGAR|nr:DUF1768-domain-containing protein [Guyanagaster necrorhizus MCA 3950]KAG7451394.1 DUF1768-domain-containing protein [Guyanagaster necrorhizus MCA 3950]
MPYSSQRHTVIYAITDGPPVVHRSPPMLQITTTQPPPRNSQAYIPTSQRPVSYTPGCNTQGKTNLSPKNARHSVPANSFRQSRFGMTSPIANRILFYDKDKPFYFFTNFSAHPVIYNGERYPTSEHLFQSFKFEHRPSLAKHIRTCSERPSVAFSEARRFQPEVRTDWKAVNISKMEVALYLKFTQHNDLKREILATGDAELVEDSPKDAFWGVGLDGRGRNELGKALMRIRERIRQDE